MHKIFVLQWHEINLW